MESLETLPILEAFDDLALKLSEFDLMLKDSDLPLWLPLNETEASIGLSQLDKARQIYTDIWHSGDGDGRETSTCYGVVGASNALIDCAKKLNESKLMFKAALTAVNGRKRIAGVFNQRSESVAKILNRQGLTRIHLKQCHRLIPISDHVLSKVTFGWYTSGRSIKKISVQECFTQLNKLNFSSVQVARELEQLGMLPASTELAQVQVQAPLMRVSMAWKNGNKNGVKYDRKARNIPMPLLVPLNACNSLPVHNVPDTKPSERIRPHRKDTKIEAIPFLPTIRVHKYI